MKPIHPQRFELAKWLAVITMVIDHYGKILNESVLIETHWIGRAAFPLFFWIIACRLAERPELAKTYAKWLLPWALISQPVIMYAGREWYEGNIMFILLLGVLAVWALRELPRVEQRAAVVIALALLAWTSDYGPLGVIAIPVVWMAAQRGLSLPALAVMGMVVNLPAESINDWISVFAALSAAVIAFVSLKLERLRLPRLPKITFYAIYPAHILGFALAVRYFEAIP